MHHLRGLRSFLNDDELLSKVEAAATHPDAVDFASLATHLSAKRVAMLRYAVKLTIAPKTMEQADVRGLKDLGFSNSDILHLAELVGYFAYVNRIADGLGVALED